MALAKDQVDLSIGHVGLKGVSRLSVATKVRASRAAGCRFVLGRQPQATRAKHTLTHLNPLRMGFAGPPGAAGVRIGAAGRRRRRR